MAVPPFFRDLTAAMQVKLRDAFLASIADIKSTVKMAALVEAISGGRANDVIDILNLKREFFAPLEEAMRSAYIDGGSDAARRATAEFPKGTVVAVRFSGRSFDAEAWIRDNSSRLVVEVTATTREAVRAVLTNGLAEGRNPRNVALDLVGRIDGEARQRSGGVVGLNSHLTGYLRNARLELEQGRYADFLTRVLRDKRMDVTLRNAIKSGKKVTAKFIDQALAKYSDSLLRFRAEAIARTEATAALNAARHEAHAQMVDKGFIEDRDIKRRWRAAGDARTRDTHSEMDNQTVHGLANPFTSPSGARLMYPGDTSLGAGGEEVINCRCYEEISVDYIAAQARKERGL